MWTVVRIPAGNNTNLHYNFVVVVALVFYYGLIQIPDLMRLDFVYQIGRKLRLKGGILSYLCLIKNKSVRIQRKHRL